MTLHERRSNQLDQIEHTLVVRYEDLRADPEHELARVVTFIEGKAEPEEIKAVVWPLPPSSR